MAGPQQLSPIEQVRRYLTSILTPQQIQIVHGLLSQIDENADGAPQGSALQEGGTEETPASLGRVDPAQARGRDATSGRGPTDRDQNRPTGFDRRRQARDEPAPFPGRPRPGGSRDPLRQEMTGFAHDTMLEDRTLRAQLRQMGVPVGDQGGLGNLRRLARAHGLQTGGMAMDSAPLASSDVDAPLRALTRIGSLSYTGGRVIHDEEPPPRTEALAYDDGGGMNSVAHYFPEVVARWAKNERSMFAVPVDKQSVRGDDRNAGRVASSAMAFDSTAASRAPSIEATFGSSFAEHLGKLGTAPR